MKNNHIIVIGLASGLYPLLYLYSSNHTLLTSWPQFLALLTLFVVLPILLLLIWNGIESRFKIFENRKHQILLFANSFIFIGLVLYATNYLNKKFLLLAFVIAFIIGFFLSRYLMKIVRFQFLLAIIGFIFLVPTIRNYLSYSNDWKSHSDAIESTRFISKPNIYFIQPDGYIGISEIVKGHYQLEGYDFDSILQSKGFKVYPDFRSNYFSTLSANSAIFTMKHHYYNTIADSASEMLNARDNILGNNSLLSILHENGYKTHAVLESPYLMVSRPKMYFSSSNINYDDVSYLSNGFDLKRDVFEDLKQKVRMNKDGQHFYFVEKMLPGHISNLKSNSDGKEKERIQYLEQIESANLWLNDVIEFIEQNDTNALVIIAADHGGFVGYEYSSQAHEKTQEKSNLNSIFSTLLAIKWTGDASEYDTNLKTSVNLFRVIFSFLSADKNLIKNQEDDSSYLTISIGAPLGIYKVLDLNGNVTFEEHK